MIKLLTALIASAAAVGVFIVYTQPAYERAQEIKTDLSQYDAALDKSRELQELKRSLLARYNTFGGTELTRLNKLLPDHIDNVRLTLDLDSLSARHGMSIQNVTLNTAQSSSETPPATVLGALGSQQKAFDSLTLQFATAGSYNQFVSFMQDLERSLRIVDVTALSIEQGADPQRAEGTAAPEPTYKFSVAIRTYWLK
jgi:hypothetical protein